MQPSDFMCRGQLLCKAPPGMHVLHKCDTPSCVAPHHLFLGTQTDNNCDMYRKGRGYERSGHKNPRAKLTPEQVASIRKDRRPQHIIAQEFGIGQSSVSRVCRAECYADDRR